MKAYITPIENLCNARCFFCITKCKEEHSFGRVLDIFNLRLLDNISGITEFEISGGGEPLLHPQINDILRWCLDRKPTTLYTNGSLLSKIDPRLANKIKFVTISHHHYLPEKRIEIMGVPIDNNRLDSLIFSGVRTRLTLVLVKGGIDNYKKLEDYLEWARNRGIKHVQVRQLFDFPYPSQIKSSFVNTNEVLKDLAKENNLVIQTGKYQSINWKGISVEFEGEKCACSDGVPNLRANGNVYVGWTSKILLTNKEDELSANKFC